MPDTYTPEQIISAKWHIGALERTDIIPKEARIPPYEDRHGQDWALENEALIILAALEAAEQERDALAAYADTLEKAGDDMRESSDGSILHCDAIRDWDVARKEKP